MSETNRESGTVADVEVFHVTLQEARYLGGSAGWYWQCDGDPHGPFATEAEARADADAQGNTDLFEEGAV